MTTNDLATLLLKQVKDSVTRFVNTSPRFRSDIDDIVQDVLVKSLSVIESFDPNEKPLRMLRGYVHTVTRTVITDRLTGLRRDRQKADKFFKNADLSVYYWRQQGDSPDSTPASLADSPHIDWDHVERLIEEYDGLFTWYEIEPDETIRTVLADRVREALEPMLE